MYILRTFAFIFLKRNSTKNATQLNNKLNLSNFITKFILIIQTDFFYLVFIQLNFDNIKNL